MELSLYPQKHVFFQYPSLLPLIGPAVVFGVSSLQLILFLPSISPLHFQYLYRRQKGALTIDLTARAIPYSF